MSKVPFGEVQGTAPGGIHAYSNGGDRHFSGERNMDGELFTGFRWQCVEFARRWLLERKGLVLPDIPWAIHIFDLKTVGVAADGSDARSVAICNGGTTKPIADALLIYPSTDDNVVGHVAAITEVGDGWVRVADQNHRFHKWAGSYSAELKVKSENGKFTIVDVDDDTGHDIVPVGWVTFPDTPDRDPSQPLVIADKFKTKSFPAMELNRVTFVPKPSTEGGNWLDVANPAEAKFVETFGMDASRTRLNEAQANYYEANYELMFQCVRAGNQLHRIFIEASAKVIASDDLLTLFGIPQQFWSRVRHSFATQRKCITGRFDFAFDGVDRLKCFEYNADSASTLLECGVIQQKWAEYVGVAENSRSGGFRVSSLLSHAWEQTGLKGRVHFCVDNDDEEQYTGLYVMQQASKVGLECKLCVMFDEFHFNGDGVVVDSDNVPVRAVWKTWNWESGFTDYFKAKEERGENWKPRPGEKVRLCDIILGDENIVVFEPLWKVIPSNKAILPLIYEAHPDHPNILKASYKLTPELIASGYAKKPIVGRCGRNVTVAAPGGDKLLESGGNYADRDTVYQEFFKLPLRDDYYAILGAWMIGEEYGGTGIREDKTIITGIESPFSALRIKNVLDWKPVKPPCAKPEE